VNAAFVCQMEAVLDLYAQTLNADQPVVCVDERPCQLLVDSRPSQPMQPGRPRRIDYEYERRGTANVFLAVQPLAGWRHLKVTARRTKTDFATFLRELADDHFPTASRIHLVVDNLNIHTPAVLYEAFTPHEAFRLARRFVFHYTPKHASWLNMAEIELSIFARFLKRRIPSAETLAWSAATFQWLRNRDQAVIQWRFTVDDARRALARLYPSTSLR
jgi:transposase